MSGNLRVNPAFEKAAEALIKANENLKTAKAAASGKTEETQEVKAYREAEKAMHAAEQVYCNLPGILSGGDLTQAEAEAKVDSLMRQVSVFYN